MRFLDHMDRWVAEHKAALAELGSLSYGRTSDDRPNHSVHLALETPSISAEVLLWESGEAELNFGVPGDAHFEHVELSSVDELDNLLERLMRLCIEDGS